MQSTPLPRDLTGEHASVAVIIPNWNCQRWLPACLAAIGAQTLPAAEVIVVDNGSEDGSVFLLREEHPEVTVVALDRNTGFAAAANIGIRAAKGRVRRDGQLGLGAD